LNKYLIEDEFENNFYKNYFGKKYLHKKKLIKNFSDVVSLEILDDMLSKTNIWKWFIFNIQNFGYVLFPISFLGLIILKKI